MECRLPVNKWTGIYCGNFYYARGPFAACRMAWHGNCYRLRTGDKFPIAKLQDIEGINDPSEDDKFKFARMGTIFFAHFNVISVISETSSLEILYLEGGRMQIYSLGFEEPILMHFGAEVPAQ